MEALKAAQDWKLVRIRALQDEWESINSWLTQRDKWLIGKLTVEEKAPDTYHLTRRAKTIEINLDFVEGAFLARRDAITREIQDMLALRISIASDAKPNSEPSEPAACAAASPTHNSDSAGSGQ